MLLDFRNELYFVFVGNNQVLPSKLNSKEGEAPLDWLRDELKRKPAKIVHSGQIIGEVTGLDCDSGNLEVTSYDNPISIEDLG